MSNVLDPLPEGILRSEISSEVLLQYIDIKLENLNSYALPTIVILISATLAVFFFDLNTILDIYILLIITTVPAIVGYRKQSKNKEEFYETHGQDLKPATNDFDLKHAQPYLMISFGTYTVMIFALIIYGLISVDFENRFRLLTLFSVELPTFYIIGGIILTGVVSITTNYLVRSRLVKFKQKLKNQRK